MALSNYECAKALQLFQRLPPKQYNTPWVLSLVGRAHFELADYTKSIQAFAEAHRLSPNNLEVILDGDIFFLILLLILDFALFLSTY